MSDKPVISLPGPLLGSNAIDPRWNNSPFFHLKTLAPRGKGSRFEKIAEAVFLHRGLDVKKATHTDHDRIVDGAKFEIKGSTITFGSDDCFSFLQIRPAQDYDYLVLETFWFDGTLKFHRIPKSDIAGLIASGVFVPQHGGKAGRSGTFIYNGPLTPFESYFWFEVQIK